MKTRIENSTKRKTMALNDKQQKAFDLIMAGKNLLITAPAGTGKSFLIEHYCRTMLARTPAAKIGVTATTGCSALLLGGQTLHSFLGIGLGEDSVDKLYHKITYAQNKFKLNTWRNLQVLIIDELSILDPKLWDKLEELARRIREVETPFGGIQLILSADFLQLPVINAGGASKARVPGEDATQMHFVFEANSWKRCIGDNIIVFDEIMRQKDPLLQEILLKIRVGCIDKQVKEVLTAHIEAEQPKNNPPRKIKPTKLFCLKKYAEDVNTQELAVLRKQGLVFYRFSAVISSANGLEDRQFDYLKSKFIKNCTTPTDIRLCIGAQVILTYNNPQVGLVNGSRGVVVSFSKHQLPVVEFTNGLQVEIAEQSWDITNDYGFKVGSFKQIPLKIGYAATIHSCQGATLDLVEVDLTDTFEYGQVYTALSRTRDIDSLIIKNLDFTKIKCHPKALAFYEDLQKQQEIDALVKDLEGVAFDEF